MAAIMDEHTPIWEEIDRAESYLVCCMFDEATSLASSILKQLLADNNHIQKDSDNASQNYCENERDDMLESAAMVFVQSLKQLQRTSEILKELKLVFGSLTAVPVQVFITGVCFQMSECPSTNIQEFLEEYLNNWSYEDERYYPLSVAEASIPDTEGSCFRFSVGVDEYLEVVELYVITLLSTTLKDTERAISWVEKALLPPEKRQELLRRLDSLNSSAATSSSQTSLSPQLPDQYRTKSDLLQDQNHPIVLESGHGSRRQNTTKEEILKLARQKAPCFWWFPTFNLKFGNTRIVVPSRNILLASMLLLVYYFTKKRHAALKTVLRNKAVAMKKAVMDLWQLAFSYQVNPLAAVQPLPTARR
ncbi:hypothetical protein RD792_014449 [Penstemon davidsonii]|uniref:Protein APEM9 n=1 Tax=Penstemon davidsonii TaxID=160366 RepID=A0ABR0CPH3_9LAMI|nr:hypothetical protein RD792_014449 [Penstemon davidsonii]